MFSFCYLNTYDQTLAYKTLTNVRATANRVALESQNSGVGRSLMAACAKVMRIYLGYYSVGFLFGPITSIPVLIGTFCQIFLGSISSHIALNAAKVTLPLFHEMSKGGFATYPKLLFRTMLVHLEHAAYDIMEYLPRRNLIAKTRNCYRVENVGQYGRGVISKNILNQFIGFFAHSHLTKDLTYQMGGQCFGATLHFISLFHELEAHERDVHKRILMVAKEFRYGAPASAAVLQELQKIPESPAATALTVLSKPSVYFQTISLYLVKKIVNLGFLIPRITRVVVLLGIGSRVFEKIETFWLFLSSKINKIDHALRSKRMGLEHYWKSWHAACDLANLQYSHQTYFEIPFVNVIFNNWDFSIQLDEKDLRKSALENIKNLPIGTYDLSSYFHATAYIKISNNLGYWFDPNVGVRMLQGENHHQDLIKLMEKYKTRGESELRFIKLNKKNVANTMLAYFKLFFNM